MVKPSNSNTSKLDYSEPFAAFRIRTLSETGDNSRGETNSRPAKPVQIESILTVVTPIVSCSEWRSRTTKQCNI
ncbi:MAG: hypothetical protein DWH78_07155 [Planctomycetota bacterium]|nr:MAG: hypothetical protein DWH78_07155 [Planctomycetota bacterium]